MPSTHTQVFFAWSKLPSFEDGLWRLPVENCEACQPMIGSLWAMAAPQPSGTMALNRLPSAVSSCSKIGKDSAWNAPARRQRSRIFQSRVHGAA